MGPVLEIDGYCWGCSEETRWRAERGFTWRQRVKSYTELVDDESKVERYFTVDDVLVCNKCGKVVPLSQWKGYQKRGRVFNRPLEA